MARYPAISSIIQLTSTQENLQYQIQRLKSIATIWKLGFDGKASVLFCQVKFCCMTEKEAMLAMKLVLHIQDKYGVDKRLSLC